MLEPRFRRPVKVACVLALFGSAYSARATNDQSVVINEVCATPAAGQEKFVEVQNRGAGSVDTINWWMCDQPSVTYIRLLQVPQWQGGGTPTSPGIVLAPGDFLVIKIHGQFPPPNGDYTTRPNNSGTTTHILRIFIPAGAIPTYVRCDAGASIGCHGNFSIWDQSAPGNPDDPAFDFPGAIRDIVGWGEGGLYLPSYNGHATTGKRLCLASIAVPPLWPPPTSGDCGIGDPTFMVIDSGQFAPGSGLSMNYNGRGANDRSDYFIAPSTEGEANVMPGDMDGDFDMDNADYNSFVACLGLPASAPGCAAADLDGSGTVDCADWPLFVADWQKYSADPLPPEPQACVSCIRGDFNNDGQVNGDDIPGFLAVVTGGDTDPQHLCAADTDGNGMVDCNDAPRFVFMALAGPSNCVPGDVNNDGIVNGDDIQPFIDRVLTGAACLSPYEICLADFTGDTIVSADDIDGFVAALLPAKP